MLSFCVWLMSHGAQRIQIIIITLHHVVIYILCHRFKPFNIFTLHSAELKCVLNKSTGSFTVLELADL